MSRDEARSSDRREHRRRIRDGERRDAGSRNHGQPPLDPWWQWLVAGAGALLVLATTGYLTYRGLTAPRGPPSVHLEVRRIEPAADGYVVVVEARNTGGETAVQLEVQGELRSGGRLLDQDGFVIDYLPPDSARRGGLMFESDPRAPGVELHIEPAGYSEP